MIRIDSLLEEGKSLRGTIRVPGDKSISHRAVMFGSLAEGTTRISGFLPGADCLSTVDCFRRLGIHIDVDEKRGEAAVRGMGMHGLSPSFSVCGNKSFSLSPEISPSPPDIARLYTGNSARSLEARSDIPPDTARLYTGNGTRSLNTCSDFSPDIARLYTGNSGTTMRILSGILAPQPFTSILSGDGSVNRRPMGRVITPLLQMGADVRSLGGDGRAPLEIRGRSLRGITYHSPVASAQVKSAILCAGLYADGPTTVIEPALSRDHTERMLRAFGAEVESFPCKGADQGAGAAHGIPFPDRPEGTDLKKALTGEGAASGIRLFDRPKGRDLWMLPPEGAWAARIRPCGRLQAQEIRVPGDISSAAYFIAAASVVPGSEILIRNVGLNPTRAGFLSAARSMGADIEIVDYADFAEPSADLLIRSAPLHGADIGGSIIPALIDEIPVLAVMAAFADGRTVIRDAAELRVKETDRIEAVAENLRAMGADVAALPDGMAIEGGRPLHGALIRTFGDHRIAMSFAIAALAAKGSCVIDDGACVGASYPGFFNALATAGASVGQI